MWTIIIAGLAIGAAIPLATQKASTTISELPLRVTVSDRAATEDYRIESDGLGDYVDGQDGVSARLDQYGNLIVNFQSTRRGTRRVSFDYSCTFVDGPQCAVAPPLDPPSGLHDKSYISTLCPDDPALACTKIQEMANNTSQCVQLNWQFIDGQGRQWRNGFQRTRDLPESEGTAYAVVTRTGTDSWTVQPSSPNCAAAVPNVARTFQVETLKSKWIYTHGETYWLPFKLTLQRVQ